MSQKQAAPDQNASASQSSNTRSTRTNSFLSKQDTVVIPIPPSLLHSGLLASPNSAFRRSYTPNKTPREQDERWLADTVPIKSPPTSPQQSAEGSNDSGNTGNTTRK
ncbi:hypothetical protein BD410DRAFT_782624 [Rickenella mellea]|uniref:Uncharacterized protein n=1 Tax=Rickenella mellea TaxID=50990 RepID=A0A4Y7QJX1_9AGAM|nr:hypothetical protein BD410DRAFT_782624 [Rickenella mellea]